MGTKTMTVSRRSALPHSRAFTAVLGALLWLCAGPAASGPVAFIHVNVLTMEGEKILRDTTVVVDDQRIVAIGRRAKVPGDARVVDGGRTLWLSPGMADMHVHSDTMEEMPLYLASGITTLLHMGDAPAELVGRDRRRIARGERPGPQILAAYVVDGSDRFGHTIVDGAETARAAVTLAKANGYEFIKVYNDLTPEAFTALALAAKDAGLPVAGHGVTAVGLRKQLEAGQAIVAHLEEFFYTFLFHDGEEQADTPPPRDRIDEAVMLLRETGSAVIVDLGAYRSIARAIGNPALVKACAMSASAAALPAAIRLEWARSSYATKSANLEARVLYLRAFARALLTAGVPLLAGTDAPTIPCSVPGAALHDNLDELVRSGFTTYQALATATAEPGRVVASLIGTTPFGVVAVGARADLVLSERNPLQGLSTLRMPIGVMAGGRWYEPGEIDRLMAETVKSYDAVDP